MESSYTAFILSVDVFTNFSIIAALVVFFWRGTWDMLDLFLLPTNYELSLWISCLGGNVLLLMMTMLQDTLNMLLTPENLSSFGLCVVTRVHAYLVATLYVCQWRGLWGLLECYGINYWIAYLVSFLALSIFGRMGQATGPPLVVMHDSDKRDYFTVIPIKRNDDSDNRSGWIAVFAETGFNLVFCNTCSAYWHGHWSVADVYLYPEDSVLSAYFSLAMSIFLAIPILTGERSVRIFCRDKHRFYIVRKLVEKAYHVVASLVSIHYWRGVWLLQTTSLLPDNPKLSTIISHVVGFSGLMMLCVSRTAVGADVFDDEDVYGRKPALFTYAFIARMCKTNDKNSNDIRAHGLFEPVTTTGH
ncbi:uncharacterized protein LOC132557804 [Ylistrum balloti]|uniref:uncharacterized protein LOC132557804 n=1 Tax=Ylistrum balloti TaxID=509963 RepID=UPI002905B26F|nr:uncharacterized protein LOC132557804 [Ylistrum balloti]